ncbi:MAG: hypothetical protein WC895_04525 [Candidatus Shapirobacteria bacterium]|jgi:hypothetical protein
MKTKEPLFSAIFALLFTAFCCAGCDEEQACDADAGPCPSASASAEAPKVIPPADAKKDEKPAQPVQPELAVVEQYLLGQAGQTLRYVSEPDHGNCYAIVGESTNGQFVPRGITTISMSNCRKR